MVEDAGDAEILSVMWVVWWGCGRCRDPGGHGWYNEDVGDAKILMVTDGTMGMRGMRRS